MTESQAHGFTWETFIKEEIYNVPDKAAYTRKNDIDSNENTFDNCAVSIKTSGSVSVDMGDARRIFEGTSSGEPYRMIVIQYTQDETHKNLKAILEIDLTNSHQELFGDVSYQEISTLHETLKKIPAGLPQNKDYLSIKKKKYHFHKGLTKQSNGLLLYSILHTIPFRHLNKPF